MYLDKSGNEWEDRHNFVKKPGKMYLVDIDYGSEVSYTLATKSDFF